MDLKSVLSDISEPECFEAVAPHWEESMATLPTGMLPFLARDAIVGNRELAGIEPAIDGELEACAARILASAALRALAWHCYGWTYAYPEPGRMLGWPSFRRSLGEGGDLFYLLVTLAVSPLILEAHQRLGVPPEITRQTMGAAASFLDRYRSGHGGANGVFKCEMWWLRNYTSGSILRIGRFEYRPYPFRGPIRVYRNRVSGATIALAEEGTRLDRDGYVVADGEEDARGWSAHVTVGRGTVRGTPIAPVGRALRHEITLELPEWREAVVAGQTTMLDMHIPSGGRMTPEAVRSSLREAAEYFASREEGGRLAGFYCVSWVFSPHLEEIFEPDANLVRLAREVYLYPIPTNRADGLFFIFSDDRYYGGRFDEAALLGHVPRTTLERRIRQFILDRRVWRGGGMFLLKEDLDQLGSRPYRSRWPKELEA